MDNNQTYHNFQVIEKYLKNLDTFKFKNFEDFENNFNDYLAVSMSLFTVLNACIEIGESLVDLKKLEFPQTYKKIFHILGKNKIISKELANDLSNYMRERNMIAHQYDEINIEDIYDLFLKKDIFQKFINETKIYF